MAALQDNPTSTRPPALDDARQQAGKFWQARAPRERQLLALAAAAVVVLLVWLVAMQPALKTLRETPVELDALDAQWQQLQLAALESEGLRSASPVPPAQAADALRGATERLGSKAKLIVQGDRATLSFTGLAFEDLRAWIGEARSGARARPVEAQLLKAATGYSGSISVTLASAS
jgi:general secretion pathway protein M